MRLGHARRYNKYIPLSLQSHTMCICFSIQIMALPWCGPSPHPESIQQKRKARTQTQTLATLRTSIWKWSILELLTFHWLGLCHMIHLITREAGKCSLAQCPGSQGERALQALPQLVSFFPLCSISLQRYEVTARGHTDR